jgi:signal transduction histidine kinase
MVKISEKDLISNVFSRLYEDFVVDLSNPVEYGLPDLLSIEDRQEQEIEITRFVESYLYAIKKGRKVKIVLINEMIRYITDLFYGRHDHAILWKPRGRGFKEKDTNKIFKRFYSNRPDKFGKHSGLGLNIVKNLVDLHDATITASNNLDKKGASIEINFIKA